MDWIKTWCILLISVVTTVKASHNNHFVHRIHVPQKIKTIFHTKIIKVPEHHHYFHEKEKIVPEHHHYIHEKEKLIKVEPHYGDDLDVFKDDSLEKDDDDHKELDDYPQYPPLHDYPYASASEPKRNVHRKRPPQRKVKHHHKRRKFH